MDYLRQFKGNTRSSPIYNSGLETTKEYWESNKPVKRQNPSVSITTIPFIGPPIPLEFIGQGVDGIIKSASFSKSRMNAAGSFQFVLHGSDNYIQKLFNTNSEFFDKTGGAVFSTFDLRDLFQPFTLVFMKMNGYLVATGLVSKVSRTFSSPSSKTYEVFCNELGCVYDKATLNMNELIALAIELGNVDRSEADRTVQTLVKTWSPPFTNLQVSVEALLEAFRYFTMGFSKDGGLSDTYMRTSDNLPLALRLVGAPLSRASISGRKINKDVILSCVSRNTPINGVLGNVQYATMAGSSFWQMLKALIAPGIMELFTESGGHTRVVDKIIRGRQSGNIPFVSGPTIVPMIPGLNYIVMRSVPYFNPYTDAPMGIGRENSSDLENTMLGVFDLFLGGDFVIITDNDVINKSLWRGEEEQSTAFYSTIPGAQLNTSTKFYIAAGSHNPIRPGGIETFGPRVKHSNIPSFNVLADYDTKKKSEQQPLRDRMNFYAELNCVYFRNASKYLNGTITTTWKPYARPGMLCFYMRDRTGHKAENENELALYYIENVTHSWDEGATPTSTFTLIRGTPMPFITSDPVNIAKLLADWELGTAFSGPHAWSAGNAVISGVRKVQSF